jgi:hypothetical protein
MVACCISVGGQGGAFFCYTIDHFQNKTVAEENLSKRHLYNVGYKTM